MHRSKLVLSLLATLALALTAGQSDAQNLATLFSFDGTNGGDPVGDLTLGGSALYGMTTQGGANGEGTAFALNLVPEPSSVVLLGMGAIGLGAFALRRRMRKHAAERRIIAAFDSPLGDLGAITKNKRQARAVRWLGRVVVHG